MAGQSLAVGIDRDAPHVGPESSQREVLAIPRFRKRHPESLRHHHLGS